MLLSYPLNKGDYLWTTEINGYSEYDRIISLAFYIEEGGKLEGLSDDSIELLLVLYCWFLSSSNRKLRDRVSKAMIKLLKNRISICTNLLKCFITVNDPYIIQRLFGIIFGAVVKRTESFVTEYEELAIYIYNEIFEKDMVYPDILLRDYARLIEEVAAFDTSIMGELKGELLIRRDILNEYLKSNNYKAFWHLIGEKQFFLGGNNQKRQKRE